MSAERISAVCSEKWKSLSEEDKQKYERLHQIDVQRYLKQMEQLEKEGHFCLDDGTKVFSTKVGGKKDLIVKFKCGNSPVREVQPQRKKLILKVPSKVKQPN